MRIFGIAAIFLAGLLTGCASSFQPTSLEVGDVGIQPFGMRTIKNPEQLDKLPLFLSSQLNYDKKPLHNVGVFDVDSELESVKSILDRHFSYRTDLQNYGKNEDWRVPLAMSMHDGVIYGDCDDYAILAKAMLKKRGIDARLLFVEMEYKGSYHVVAEVQGWIIDNRKRGVIAHNNTDYKILSVSSAQASDNWYSTR